MAEQKTKVNTYLIEYFCDECGASVKAGAGYTNSIGSKFQHLCSNKECKKEYDFGYNVCYPYQVTEKINKRKST